MARMMRCKASMSLNGSWGVEHLWPGRPVDMDRELAPGVTVAEAVRGRESEFEDIDEEIVSEPVDPNTDLIGNVSPFTEE